MLVTEQEIHEIKNFVSHLNSMKKSAVVVEGKKDTAALRKVGFSGKILEFHKFGGMVNFADSVAKYERLIILFDRDRKGRTFSIYANHRRSRGYRINRLQSRRCGRNNK